MTQSPSKLKSSLSAQQLIKKLENPPSITEFTTPYFTRHIQKLDAELCDLSEPVLLETIRGNVEKTSWQPSSTTEALRQSFWDQYEIAVRYQVKIQELKVFENICTEGVFQKQVEDPITLSWILCKPLAYEQKIGALLDKGYRRFEEFIDLPVRDKMGNVNEKLVDTIFKITTAMDLRLRGGYTQRSEQMIRQQTEVIHSGNSTKQVEADVKDLDAKILELENKIRETQRQLPAPSDDSILVGLTESLDARKPS